MILRRLAEAIREQSWFTVVLELLVVIFGVYIGIYLGNEAEKRTLDVKVNAALVALRADLETDVARIDEILEVQGTYIATQFEAIRVLAETPADPKEFARLYDFIRSNNDTLFPSMAAYDAMRTTGYLTALKDANLRLDLARLFEREYVRQNYNALIYDQRRTSYFQDVVISAWDNHNDVFLPPVERNIVLLRNGMENVNITARSYLYLLTELVRPTGVGLIADINTYLATYSGDTR